MSLAMATCGMTRLAELRQLRRVVQLRLVVPGTRRRQALRMKHASGFRENPVTARVQRAQFRVQAQSVIWAS